MSYQVQGVVISSTKPSWGPSTRSVTQGSSWISITVRPSEHWWDGAHPQKFVGSTELGGVFGGPDGCAAPRKALDGLEKWAGRNLMKLHKGKCKALHLGRCLLGCPRVSVVGRLGEVMMPFSSALVRHIWKALAGCGLPKRTGQVSLWRRGGNSLTGSKWWGLFDSVCLEIVWKGEWMVRWWKL